MTRPILIALVAAFVASPAAAQDADRDAMVRAIADAGCRVTAENNAAVLEAAGLGEDAAAAVVQSLLESGEAVTEGGALVLKTGGCS